MSPLARARVGVEELRWYRFGYLGPGLGAVQVLDGGDGLRYRLVRLSVRPTTDAERLGPDGLFRDAETVAILTWEPIS